MGANQGAAAYGGMEQQVNLEMQYFRDFYEYAMNNQDYFMNLI